MNKNCSCCLVTLNMNFNLHLCVSDLLKAET